jgi:hypothetical protein
MSKMCQHIIDHGSTDTAMVLIHIDEADAFTCPTCAMNYVQALLEQGTTLNAIVDTLHFTHCQHTEGSCKRCVRAFKGELAARSMRIWLVDGNKTAANRLGKLHTAINKRYRESIPPLLVRMANKVIEFPEESAVSLIHKRMATPVGDFETEPNLISDLEGSGLDVWQIADPVTA